MYVLLTMKYFRQQHQKEVSFELTSVGTKDWMSFVVFYKSCIRLLCCILLVVFEHFHPVNEIFIIHLYKHSADT